MRYTVLALLSILSLHAHSAVVDINQTTLAQCPTIIAVRYILYETDQLHKALLDKEFRHKLLHQIDRPLTMHEKRNSRIVRALKFAQQGDDSFLKDLIYNNCEEAHTKLSELIENKNQLAIQLWTKFQHHFSDILH